MCNLHNSFYGSQVFALAAFTISDESIQMKLQQIDVRLISYKWFAATSFYRKMHFSSVLRCNFLRLAIIIVSSIHLRIILLLIA